MAVDTLLGIKPPKDKAERKQWRATLKAQAKIESAIGFPSVSQPFKKPIKPANFPMSFKVFLRRMFGGRYYADRLRLFRKFAFQEFRSQQQAKDGNLSPEALDAAAEVMRDQLIQTLQRDGIFDTNWYFRINERIHDWRPANRVKQRREANASRRLKENRKKILRLLKWRINALSQPEKCSLASKKAEKMQVRTAKSDTSHP